MHGTTTYTPAARVFLFVQVLREKREEEDKMELKCGICGTALTNDAKFCLKCGDATERLVHQAERPMPLYDKNKPASLDVKPPPAAGIMIFISILMIIGGIVAIYQGGSLNRDPMAFWQYGPNPGGNYIIAGVLLVFAGIVLFALGFWKKHQRP